MNPGFTSADNAFETPADEQAEVIDEEELHRLRELKDLKRQYRTTFGELKELQKETKYTQTNIDNQKQKLIADFEEWYADTFEEEGAQNTSAAVGSTMQISSANNASRISSTQVSLIH